MYVMTILLLPPLYGSKPPYILMLSFYVAGEEREGDDILY